MNALFNRVYLLDTGHIHTDVIEQALTKQMLLNRHRFKRCYCAGTGQTDVIEQALAKQMLLTDTG